MKINEYINTFKLETYINNGYVSITYHPKFENIAILTYTKKCQAERFWDDVTEKCRGLIYDTATNEILAIPFKKFYNYEEYEDKSEVTKNITDKFDIYEKLDGSLGILYWIADMPYIATKGSFSSDQANHATKILHTKYSNIFRKLDRDITYLFEIIYPEDLHVVTYKGIDDIFLIGAINKNTGEDINISNIDDNLFNKTKAYYGIENWLEIRNIVDGKNKEGFVIRFNNGFRVKLKYEEYWKLHFLKAGLSKSKILDYYINGKEDELFSMISEFDEEHQIYYNAICNNLLNVYIQVHTKCVDEYPNMEKFPNRKAAAEYFKTCTYPAIMFTLYDCNYNKCKNLIWKEVKNILKS